MEFLVIFIALIFIYELLRSSLSEIKIYLKKIVDTLEQMNEELSRIKFGNN